MKHEIRIGFVGSSIVCFLCLLGLTGCSNNADTGKPTPQDLAAFRGDPSKMPENMKGKIAADQNAAMQKANTARDAGIAKSQGKPTGQ